MIYLENNGWLDCFDQIGRWLPNDPLVLICQGLRKPEMETSSNLHYVCSFSGLVTTFIMLNFVENANDSV